MCSLYLVLQAVLIVVFVDFLWKLPAKQKQTCDDSDMLQWVLPKVGKSHKQGKGKWPDMGKLLFSGIFPGSEPCNGIHSRIF